MTDLLNSLSPDALKLLRTIAREAANRNYPHWRQRMFLPMFGTEKAVAKELFAKGATLFDSDMSQLSPKGCEVALYLIG